MVEQHPHLAHYIGKGHTSQRVRDKLAARLQQQGILNQQVLDAIRFTPRHSFIDGALSTHAYDDTALPIGYAQTISQPYVVARMSACLLEQAPNAQKVLEIGTGCGYQTAILAQLFPEVYTVERIGGLLQQAQYNLAALGLRQIHYYHGDGYQGWAEHAPYDAILVTAAAPEIPPALLAQLNIGASLLIPVVAANGQQHLDLVQRQAQGYRHQRLDPVKFVPLKQGLS